MFEPESRYSAPQVTDRSVGVDGQISCTSNPCGSERSSRTRPSAMFRSRTTASAASVSSEVVGPSRRASSKVQDHPCSVQSTRVTGALFSEVAVLTVAVVPRSRTVRWTVTLSAPKASRHTSFWAFAAGPARR